MQETLTAIALIVVILGALLGRYLAGFSLEEEDDYDYFNDGPEKGR